MEKIKLCEICGKEVVKGRDKYLNILNKYYHDDCLKKEKVIVKDTMPTFSADQVARMTFEEKLVYLDERIRNLVSKYSVPEEEVLQARQILRQLSEQYGMAAKAQEKGSKPPSS
ncbi:MAG: hypothetical protein LUO85_05525 [Methanomassiliicoccales archaeon]|nr:hypothetical protein [Methanomassiliicoccales archaeon]